jgi:hypothetical protein
MASTNPFTATGYDLISMTMAINSIPDAQRMIGRTEQLGLFTPQPITTTSFTVEKLNGVLNLLVSQPRGGPAPKNTTAKRELRSFAVPHYPLEDVIRPDEVQGVRAFGTENQAETVAGVMARKLAEMRMKHELTREWLRFQALKGIVLDGDGSTLYNFFTEFGLSQETQSFELDQAGTDVNSLCRAALRYMRTHLFGDIMTGARAFCSPGFYDALILHASVKDAFKYFQTNQSLSTDVSGSFTFAGIAFEPVESSTTDPAGTARKFIADNEAMLFPIGTRSTFQEVIAPADFMETANTPGLPFYAKQEPMKFGRGVEVHTQQNVLPVCTRPGAVVRLTLT